MKILNRAAADALRPFSPNAVTDVTGFGLLGHTHELASRSGVRAVLDAAALPALPGAASWPPPACAPAATAGTASSQARTSNRRPARRPRRSPTTRRPPVAC